MSKIFPSPPKKKAVTKRKSRKKRRKSRHPGNVENLQREYKLSPALSNLLNARRASRGEVVKAIWKLAKERNLNDGRNIHADAAFFECFGKLTINFYDLAGLLSDHLTPLADGSLSECTDDTASENEKPLVLREPKLEETVVTTFIEATPKTIEHCPPRCPTCHQELPDSTIITRVKKETSSAQSR